MKLSIIIPTKNIPALLQRCLDSIPQRDDQEIIVIDDNSDPTIVNFEKYPGHDRKDVKLIFNKDGLGAGHARNVGLRYASGEWLIFVDSDDFLIKGSLDEMKRHLDPKYDIIYTLPKSVDTKTLEPSYRVNSHIFAVKKAKDKDCLEKYLRYSYTEPWGKFIKRELIEKYRISFDETMVSNDYLFSLKSGHYACNIKFLEISYYCITTREGSLCNKIFDSDEKVLERARAYLNVQKFLDENKLPYYPLYTYLTFALKEKKIKLVANFYKSKGITNKQILKGMLKSYFIAIKSRFK